MRWLKTLGCFVLLGLLAAAGAAWWAWSALHRPYGEGEEAVLIEPGTDAGTILAELAAAGVIPDARLARAWLIYGLGDPPLHAGEYRFELPLTPVEVLDKLIRGDVVLHQVTVVEGLTLEETAQALADAGFGELDRFLAAMRDPAPIADLDPEAETLEGYLFPETYSFIRGTGEREIVRALVETFRRRFEEQVQPLMEGTLVLPGGAPPPEAPVEAEEPDATGVDGEAGSKAPGTRAPEREEAPSTSERDLSAIEKARPEAAHEDEPDEGAGVAGAETAEEEPITPATPPDAPRRPIDSREDRERRWTVRELVTLASIVEKEVRVEDERRLIAAVYANRLAAGMGLYADPTVIFALKLRGEWDGNLTRENLQLDSPYNTYRYGGLPPGPIASPGLGSLRAAADPADVPYLYFVSRNDGTHVFSRTLSEHNANVRRWQQEYWRRRWAEEAKKRDASPPPD